jgi:hypothetical protein
LVEDFLITRFSFRLGDITGGGINSVPVDAKPGKIFQRFGHGTLFGTWRVEIFDTQKKLAIKLSA